MGDREESLKPGERRFAAVLFSDMKGFTALSGKMDPEEIDSLITTIFNQFEAIIKRYEGTVEKYIGDALVAVFGVPKIHEDDTIRAVYAALDFLDAVRLTNKRLKGRNVELVFRTGIDAGIVTTGIRGEYDVVTGRPMSLASRLQEAAPPNGILITEAVRERCGTEFTFSESLRILPKGVDTELTVYRVIERSALSLQYSTPFVGRVEIMNALLRGFMKAEGKAPAGFILLGEAGIGKTRILAQLIEKVRQFPGNPPAVLLARAKKFRPEPFSLVNELLLSYLHAQQRISNRSVEDELVSGLGVDGETVRKFLSLLTDGSHASDDSGAFVILYLILVSILRKHQESPYAVFLAIDNCQNIDAQSLDFFRFFLKSTEIHPFILLAGRNENRAVLDVFKDLARLEVPPFSAAEGHELFRSLWDFDEDASLEQKVLEYSAGNPLFIEEYVKYAEEHEDFGALPDTIQNIYLSAMERLEPGMRDLLKKLSVFIHSFTIEDARYIEEHTDGDAERIEEALQFFVKERYLVQENGFLHFKSDALKQALYNSVLNHNKKILHRLVSERLRGQESPNIQRLIHHLIRAGDYAGAGAALARDPGYLQKMDYLPYLDSLIEHSRGNDDSEFFRFMFTKAGILFNNGKKDDSEEVLEEMMHLAISAGKEEYIARVYHLLCAFFLSACEFGKAIFCGRKALFYYGRTNGGQKSAQNVYNFIAHSHLLRNELDENLRVIEAMEHTSPEGGFDMKAAAMCDRLIHTGDYRGAVRMAEGTLREEGLSDSERAVSSRQALAMGYRKLFAYDKMRAVLKLQVSVKYLSATSLAQIYAMLAEGCFMCGDRDKIQDYLRQSEYYLYQIQNDFDLIEASRYLAAALLITGNSLRAEELARLAVERGLRHSIYLGSFSLLMVLTEIAFSGNRIDECRFFLREAKFLVDSGMLLDRQDLILYHYFSYRADRDAGELELAYRLLGEERELLGEPAAVSAFLAARSFGRVALEYQKVGNEAKKR